MKITKSYLKQLIREELSKYFTQYNPDKIKAHLKRMTAVPMRRSHVTGGAQEGVLDAIQRANPAVKKGIKNGEIPGFYNTNNGNIAIYGFADPENLMAMFDSYLETGRGAAPTLYGLASYADHRYLRMGKDEDKMNQLHEEIVEYLESQNFQEHPGLFVPMSPENLKSLGVSQEKQDLDDDSVQARRQLKTSSKWSKFKRGY